MLLAPANRAEFLIKGGRQAGHLPGRSSSPRTQQFLESAQKTDLRDRDCRRGRWTWRLPTALPPPTRYYPLIKPQDIERVRTVEFGGAFPGVANPYVGIDFLLNNMQYQVDRDPDRGQPAATRRNGTSSSRGPHHGGTEGHPFHIHAIRSR